MNGKKQTSTEKEAFEQGHQQKQKSTCLGHAAHRAQHDQPSEEAPLAKEQIAEVM